MALKALLKKKDEDNGGDPPIAKPEAFRTFHHFLNKNLQKEDADWRIREGLEPTYNSEPGHLDAAIAKERTQLNEIS